MKKKGFTLIELLVVIAIIAVLTLIVIPSVIKINRNVNERLLSGKIEEIESSAILYASNNQEIFNGTDEAYVYVYELIESNYLTVDVKTTDDRCPEANRGATTKGCMVDPTAESNATASLNMNYVVLRKQGAGVTADYQDGNPSNPNGDTPTTLVDAVCIGFDNGTFVGQTTNASGTVVSCKCNAKLNATKLVDSSNNEVEACLIAGDNPNNYLRYGDSKPNWRVLGVYKVNGSLSAKMITSEPV